tara:strand:- start:735 stop:1604 length:870 start_codon:yes stop_codon:yes gene_type:complete
MERQLRMGGGIMNAVPREEYGLGSFLKKGFKKITKGVKKIAKSPLGKAAMLYFGGNLLQGNPLFGNPFGASNPFQGRITDGIGNFFRNTVGDKVVDKVKEETTDELLGVGKSFLAGSLLPSILGEDPDNGGGYQRDLPALRAKLIESYRNQKTFSGSDDEEAAIAEQVERDMAGFQQDMNRANAAYGGRMGFAMGPDNPEENAIQASGIMGLPLNENPAGVTELDLRETGGFIPPVGVKEKADDIPAMLADNEFVFTADAVRGMGDGDVNQGAQRMYDMMKKLENGGRV